MAFYGIFCVSMKLICVISLGDFNVCSVIDESFSIMLFFVMHLSFNYHVDKFILHYGDRVPSKYIGAHNHA